VESGELDRREDAKPREQASKRQRKENARRGGVTGGGAGLGVYTTRRLRRLLEDKKQGCATRTARRKRPGARRPEPFYFAPIPSRLYST
jgi:hypothetical protein